VVTDAPGDIEGVQGAEVFTQRGVLHQDPELGRVAVDVVQQGVHVGELHRGIEELLVTSLQAGVREQQLVPLGAEPWPRRAGSSQPH
jgi:hypothetical protein